ncbi:MAG: LPS export ABC transporter ATP-binding protein, partial [Nitrospirae bacterium]|nr:LPS export ABC transporter ATP-binding protein [Nitrospirota bacterium]
MGLRTVDIAKRYGKKVVVRGVTLELSRGEVVGLLGPNGAGKTTVFSMMVGITRPSEGTIFLKDQEITRMPMYQRARIGLSYLPQETSIFRKLTVEENILAVLEMQPLSSPNRIERLEELLDELHVSRVRKQAATTLSGGERRRVEIARALATSPAFLLLDEPFAGVDPISVMEIQQIIGRLREKGIGILVTDHNVQETLA